MSKEKRSKKEMSDTKRVVLFTFVIVLVVVLIGVTSFFVLREKDEEKENETVKTNTQEISGYGITVDDLDSEYYKLEFEKLKANLESKNVDMDAYAESVARLFLIDLYTIKTKINKYDIGGIEVVLPEARDNFVVNVTDTIYKFVEDNTIGISTQCLPVVSDLSVIITKLGDFNLDGCYELVRCFVFVFEIGYSSDLGYDTKAEITVINRDKFMYVVEKN